MKFAPQTLLLSASLVTLLALTGCSKKEDADNNAPATAQTAAPAPAPTPDTTAAPTSAAVSVASVDLGTGVDGDSKVATPGTAFSPKDTIYASVATTGSGTAKLDAKWTYQDGQTVNQDSSSITPTGPANTAFHISKPDGLPVGNYKVEISVDGKSVSSKDFSVK